MSDTEKRLIRCFALVFPNLAPEQIRTASVESVPGWDSLATITIVALLEQEFGVKIDLLDLPELGSFEAMRNFVVRHESNG